MTPYSLWGKGLFVLFLLKIVHPTLFRVYKIPHKTYNLHIHEQGVQNHLPEWKAYTSDV